MRSMLHLTSSHGLPLCLSSIPPPLTLSKEMADHDRRRKEVKKLRSRMRSHAVPELMIWRDAEITAVQRILEGEVDGELGDLSRDLSHGSLSVTAKAA